MGVKNVLSERVVGNLGVPFSRDRRPNSVLAGMKRWSLSGEVDASADCIRRETIKNFSDWLIPLTFACPERPAQSLTDFDIRQPEARRARAPRSFPFAPIKLRNRSVPRLQAWMRPKHEKGTDNEIPTKNFFFCRSSERSFPRFFKG